MDTKRSTKASCPPPDAPSSDCRVSKISPKFSRDPSAGKGSCPKVGNAASSESRSSLDVEYGGVGVGGGRVCLGDGAGGAPGSVWNCPREVAGAASSESCSLLDVELGSVRGRNLRNRAGGAGPEASGAP